MRWSRRAASNAAWRRSSPSSTRVARFGFTAPELSRMKLNLQRGLERAVVEKDKSPSGPLADEFVRNFIQDEPIPGIVYEYGLNQRFLPEITLAEVNAVAKDWMPDRNRLVAISAPESDRASLPNEVEAGRRDQRGQRRERLTAYVDTTSNAAAARAPPAAGSRRHHVDQRRAGHHRMEAVQRRPRRAQADDVQAGRDPVSGRQPGRHVARERRGLHPGRNRRRGHRARRSRRLQPTRSGEGSRRHDGVGAEPTSATTEEGLAGGAARKDLETMFQLIYLTFTAPRADPVAFGVLTDQLKVTLANQQAQPDAVFDQALDAALSQNHLRAQPLTPATRRSDEPRQVAGVLQGPLRRCERLHLRLRRQLRSRDHEAAGRAIPGQPAVAAPERGREGRRHPSSGGRRREAGEERHRPAEPGQHRLQRAVPERRAASSDRHGHGAIRSPATCSARCARTWAAPTASAWCRASRSVRRRSIA